MSCLLAEQRRVYELLSEAPRTITELTEALNPGHVVRDLRRDQKCKNVAKLVYKLRDRELVFQRPFDKRWAPSTQEREQGYGGNKRHRENRENTGREMFPLVLLLSIRARGTKNQAMTRVLGVVPPFPLFPLEIQPPPIGPLSLREKPAAGKAEEREKRPG